MIKPNTYLSILFFSLYLSGFSQKKDFDVQKKYTVKQVLADIDYTEKYICKFHPDPYQYITKDSLYSFVEYIKTRVDTPLTEMQIRYCIKRIISQIGCGHTDVAASKKYAKAVKKINRPILPLNVFVADSSKLFVLNNLSTDSTIATGDEIVSIDGRSIKNILKTIYSVATSDGYNQTYKKQTTRYNSFKYYYSFCYGFKLNYSVKIKHTDHSIRDHQLGAISTLKDTLILPKKDSLIPILKTKACQYSVINDDKQIAVIDINAFKGRHWRSFTRKTFKDIKRKQIQNVVIDLRDNGGGQIAYGVNLLSYLLEKNIGLSFDRKPNLMMFNPRYMMDPGSRTLPLIFSAFMPGRIKDGRLRHYIIGIPKTRHAFKGNVYVLTNGKSFSMSAVVSTYLKHEGNATIIGEETGGNISGSNAVISGHITLPNTKIKIFIPMYHIYHHFNVKNDGHGLMPDNYTEYTKEAVLNGTDLDLEKVKALVN